MKAFVDMLKMEADLAAFAAQMDSSLEAITRAVVLELLRRIVERTPVDKGRACGSWAVSQGQPGEWQGLAADTQGGAANRQISLDSIGKVSFHPPDGIYWIFNNLPYIHVLEFGLYSQASTTGKTVAGFSIQAPAGMVRIALAEMETDILQVVQRAA